MGKCDSRQAWWPGTSSWELTPWTTSRRPTKWTCHCANLWTYKTWRKKLKQRPWRRAFSWFTLHAFQTVFYHPEPPFQEVTLPAVSLAFHPQSSNKNMYPRLVHGTLWRGHLLNWGSPLQNNCSLCEAGPKLFSIVQRTTPISTNVHKWIVINLGYSWTSEGFQVVLLSDQLTEKHLEKQSQQDAYS